MTDVLSLAGIARSLVIYYGQPWKTAWLRGLYRGIVGPGDLAFDIGAHVGNRSRILVGLGAKVVSLEPQPAFVGVLKRVLPEGAVLVAKAVGSAPGTAHLSVSRRHPTVSTLSTDWIDRVSEDPSFRRVSWDETVEVPVTTLDALIAEFGMPRFIKIDVEGFEAEILKGLSQPVPWIAFEVLPAALDVALACLDRLEALGPYEFNRTEGEDHVFLEPHWQSAGVMADTIRRVARSGRSGDVYARLETSGTRTPGSAPASETRP